MQMYVPAEYLDETQQNSTIASLSLLWHLTYYACTCHDEDMCISVNEAHEKGESAAFTRLQSAMHAGRSRRVAHPCTLWLSPLSLPHSVALYRLEWAVQRPPVRQRHRHRHERGRTDAADGRTKAPSFPPPVCPSVVRASFFLALFAANDEFSFQRACNWLQEGRRTPPRHIYSPLLRTIYWHNLSQKHVLA